MKKLFLIVAILITSSSFALDKVRAELIKNQTFLYKMMESSNPNKFATFITYKNNPDKSSVLMSNIDNTDFFDKTVIIYRPKTDIFFKLNIDSCSASSGEVTISQNKEYLTLKNNSFPVKISCKDADKMYTEAYISIRN